MVRLTYRTFRLNFDDLFIARLPIDLYREHDGPNNNLVTRSEFILGDTPVVEKCTVGGPGLAAPPGAKAGAVLDGRDIGTVVCPEAEVKIFVTASLEGRARRRHKELLERGEASIYARVVQEMRARDRRDSERAAAPLRPAPDAVVLDTNALDAGEAFRAALEVLHPRRSALAPGTRPTTCTRPERWRRGGLTGTRGR